MGKRGRTSKLNEASMRVIIQTLEAGGTDIQAAQAINVTANTIYNWARDNPDLKEAMAIARQKAAEKKAPEVLASLEDCRALAENYVIRLLKGEVYKTKTRTGGDGTLFWTEKELVMPSEKILERFLPAIAAQDVAFTLNIGTAMPPPQLEDGDFDMDGDSLT